MVGVNGPAVACTGLKFNNVSRILLAIVDRVRIRMPRQFIVAFTRIASLVTQSVYSNRKECLDLTPSYLEEQSEVDPVARTLRLQG
jgi:hypothetical protein